MGARGGEEEVGSRGDISGSGGGEEVRKKRGGMNLGLAFHSEPQGWASLKDWKGDWTVEVGGFSGMGRVIT